MNVNAIILAAGRGRRLEHLTQNRPKCLVELGGRPLINWQIDALRGGGIDQIATVGGYKSELLHFPDIARMVNTRWQETEMVASLLCASAWLERTPCVVSYADIFYPAAIVSDLSSSAADIAISYDPNWLDLWRQRFTDPLSDAESFALAYDGTLTEIGGKAATVDEIKGQYMGLLYFTPAGWAVVTKYLALLSDAEIDRLSMTALLARLIERGVKILAIALHGQWGEIDSPEDLHLYEAMMTADRRSDPTL